MAAIYTAPTDARPFKYGLFDCMGDINTCIFAFFVPCLLVMSNAEALGEHPLFTCCILSHPMGSWLLRLKLRLSQNIQGDFIEDCWTMNFCGPCALVQLTREIKDIQASQ